MNIENLKEILRQIARNLEYCEKAIDEIRDNDDWNTRDDREREYEELKKQIKIL